MDNNNFNLYEDSPCINAGNPDFPTDSNNTNSDIGAITYNNNCLLEGDANNDSIINILDITQIICEILTPLSCTSSCDWDINQDGLHNVIDIVAIINLIID